MKHFVSPTTFASRRRLSYPRRYFPHMQFKISSFVTPRAPCARHRTRAMTTHVSFPPTCARHACSRSRSSRSAVASRASASANRAERVATPNDAQVDANDRVRAFLSKPGRHASFEATKIASKRVVERMNERALRAYMSLPASAYSTLDGERVERTSDDTFRVELTGFNFLGMTIAPRLKAKVVVRGDGSGCEVRVDAMELRGSGVVEHASDAFEIVSVNNVTWRDVSEEELTEDERERLSRERCEFKEITSETSVRVYLIVPGWFPFTVKSTERTGRFVVNQVVGQVVPRFLNQLATDYAVWATGDDSREASSNGMFDVDVETADT